MGLWVRPMPRGGLSPPFPRSALGVRPEDPFRVAQRLAPSSLGYGVRSKEGVPSSAAFGAAPARISPGTRLTRQRGEVAASRPHVRPRHHPGSRFPPPYRAGPVGSRPRAQRNLNKAGPTPPHSLQARAFLARALLTRHRPRGRLPLRRTTCWRKERTKRPPHHLHSPV